MEKRDLHAMLAIDTSPEDYDDDDDDLGTYREVIGSLI